MGSELRDGRVLVDLEALGQFLLNAYHLRSGHGPEVARILAFDIEQPGDDYGSGVFYALHPWEMMLLGVPLKEMIGHLKMAHEERSGYPASSNSNRFHITQAALIELYREIGTEEEVALITRTPALVVLHASSTYRLPCPHRPDERFLAVRERVNTYHGGLDSSVPWHGFLPARVPETLRGTLAVQHIPTYAKIFQKADVDASGLSAAKLSEICDKDVERVLAICLGFSGEARDAITSGLFKKKEFLLLTEEDATAIEQAQGLAALKARADSVRRRIAPYVQCTFDEDVLINLGSTQDGLETLSILPWRSIQQGLTESAKAQILMKFKGERNYDLAFSNHKHRPKALRCPTDRELNALGQRWASATDALWVVRSQVQNLRRRMLELTGGKVYSAYALWLGILVPKLDALFSLEAVGQDVLDLREEARLIGLVPRPTDGESIPLFRTFSEEALFHVGKTMEFFHEDA